MENSKILMKRLLILLAVIFVWDMMYAQKKNNITKVDSYSVHGNYSIGQTFYGDEKDSDDSLNSDKICPYLIEIMTGRTEPSINLKAFVFSDSTADYVQLEVIEGWYKNLQYDLRNADGRSIISEEVKLNKTKIDFSKLPCSCYFLVVTDAEATIKTFKIVKTI